MATISTLYPEIVQAAEAQNIPLDQVFATVETDANGIILTQDPLVSLDDGGHIPIMEDGTIITNSYLEMLANTYPDSDYLGDLEDLNSTSPDLPDMIGHPTEGLFGLGFLGL